MTTMQVHLRMVRPTAFARGGLAQAAGRVRDAGREDDTMLVHITPTEFEALKDMFGEPTIHPKTGMPEFGLWKSIKKAAKWAAPLISTALPIVAPGVGQSVGELFGAGPEWAGALGSGVIGGALGLVGGPQTALLSGLGGALSGYYSPDVRGYLGLGASGPVGSPELNDVISRTIGDAPGSALGEYTGSAGLMDAAGKSVSTSGGILGGGVLSKALPAVLVASALTGGSRQKAPPPPQQQQNNTPLPQLTLDRKAAPTNNVSWYNYGELPAFSFFVDNKLPSTPNDNPEDEDDTVVVKAARGGRAGSGGGLGQMQAMYVGEKTPSSGRADDVPALLSNNEYVLPAEEMAMLGDGSPAEGARRMDKMRVNLRRHKGGALARGKISPNARRPEQYMRGSRGR